jgi:hypothetical protein
MKKKIKLPQYVFTPGPWEVLEPYKERPSGYYVNSKGNRSICEMTGRAWFGDTPTAHQNRANATLIATAPDLLAWMKISLDQLQQYRNYSESMRKIGRGCSIASEFTPEHTLGVLESLIAKAEGGVLCQTKKSK